MAVDDIKAWIDEQSCERKIFPESLDALCTAVEALDAAARKTECGFTCGYLCAKLDTIRETLGIPKETSDGS